MKWLLLKIFKLYLVAFILWNGAYLVQHYYSWYVVGFHSVTLTTEHDQVYEGYYTPRPGLSAVFVHPLKPAMDCSDEIGWGLIPHQKCLKRTQIKIDKNDITSLEFDHQWSYSGRQKLFF
ncbi:hypothetical protein [Moraxella canis]|uniref:hypothetical protein n=1 Tax=Moraxella canis TaxID=90239 RepID=UPI000665979E|nr:hypothetical protein [Moraxella canis]